MRHGLAGRVRAVTEVPVVLEPGLAAVRRAREARVEVDRQGRRRVDRVRLEVRDGAGRLRHCTEVVAAAREQRRVRRRQLERPQELLGRTVSPPSPCGAPEAKKFRCSSVSPVNPTGWPWFTLNGTPLACASVSGADERDAWCRRSTTMTPVSRFRPVSTKNGWPAIRFAAQATVTVVAPTAVAAAQRRHARRRARCSRARTPCRRPCTAGPASTGSAALDRRRVRVLVDVRVLDAADAEARDAPVPEEGGLVLVRRLLRLGVRPGRMHRRVRRLIGRRVGRNDRRRHRRQRSRAGVVVAQRVLLRDRAAVLRACCANPAVTAFWRFVVELRDRGAVGRDVRARRARTGVRIQRVRRRRRVRDEGAPRPDAAVRDVVP